MAFPEGWSGHDTIVISNPDSDLTEFTFLLSLSSLSSTWKEAVAADGGDIRVSDENNNLLPLDVISAYTGGTTGLIAFKFSPASSGSQKIRIWCGNSGESQPSESDIYGRFNAYASHVRGFWPSGGGDDRTQYLNHFTMTGSPSVGGTAGPINGSLATDYNGSTQYGTATASVPTAAPVAMISWFNADSVSGNHAKVVLTDTASSTNYLWLDHAVTAIRARLNDGTTAANSTASTVVVGNWAQAAARFVSNTSRFAYLNTTEGSENTTDRTPGSIDSIGIGAANSSSVTNHHDGKISLTWLHDADVGANWIAYVKEMLDDADQSDFYTFEGWTEGSITGNAVFIIKTENSSENSVTVKIGRTGLSRSIEDSLISTNGYELNITGLYNDRFDDYDYYPFP